jgi:transposase
MPLGFRRAVVSADAPPAPSARAIRRALPPVGRLRRERRDLVRTREEKLRDLGGLMLEMFRRDQFRRELLLERCADLVALEERMGELDTLIEAAVSRGRVQPAVRCECGAPIFWGARFCGQCGRPVAGT